MTNVKNETTNANSSVSLTLAEKAKAFRDIARETLRLEKMNRLLQKLFKANVTIKQEEERNERMKNEVARVEMDIKRQKYQLSKLDKNDPDYETKKEYNDNLLETVEKELKETEDKAEKVKEDVKTSVREIEEHIERVKETMEKVENGEWKVSIEDVNRKANEYCDVYGNGLAVNVGSED